MARSILAGLLLIGFSIGLASRAWADELPGVPRELAMAKVAPRSDAPAVPVVSPVEIVRDSLASFRVLAPASPETAQGCPRPDLPRRYSTTMVQVAHPPPTFAPEPAHPVSNGAGDYCMRQRPIDFFRLIDSADDPGTGGAEGNLLRRPDVPSDPKVVAAGRLARKLAWRQVRRFFRSELRDRYKHDFTMDYYGYLAERDDIGRLGRDHAGLTGEDFELQKTRQSVLGSADEVNVEPEIALLDWGPLQLNDSGQLRVDVNKLRAEPSAQALTIAPETDPDAPLGESLFHDRLLRLNTDIKLRPDLGALVGGEGYRAVLGEIGAAVKVDFFSAILEKRYLSAEIETSLDEDGDAGLFVSFTLHGR